MNHIVNKLMNLEKELVLKAENGCDGFNSPREWDNLGTMITWQNRYISPDKNDFSSPTEFFESIVGEKVESRIFEDNDNNASYFAEISKHLDKQGYISLPVYCYNHSRTIYSTGTFSCPWDSGMVGVIYATKEKIYEEFGVKRITSKIREKIKKIFQAECEEYTQWANGEVYSFTLEDLQGNHIDSCSGFYEDFYDDSIFLETVGAHVNLYNLKDWKEYHEDVISENFKLVKS